MCCWTGPTPCWHSSHWHVALVYFQVADLQEVLVGLRLSPAIASACGAVVALTQDCEDNQRAFLANPDFLPALFRLLGSEEPHVAVQAGR